MTDRLYYKDQYLKEFTANVVSCTEKDGRFEVVLDKSAFFPEGGGQPGDKGFIADAEVKDTIERDGEVYHICAKAVSVGEVNCKLDFNYRFENMQQHSGEHIFSGVAHSLYGCDNVGFHMGENYVTVDFNKTITAEQLAEIERLSNEAVFSNIPIVALYPIGKEVDKYDYRSKKEIDGQLRLTKIEGVDLCACCGTHVRLTGEIGIIKAVSMAKYKSGVRIVLQIGRKALADYCEKNNSVHAISNLLCAKTEEVAEAVEKLQAKMKDADFRYAALKKELFAEKSKNISGDKCCVFDDAGSADDARVFADMLADKVKIAAVFSGSDDSGYKYAVVSRTEDCREIGKSLNAVCNGRGGGKPDMIQGSVAATKETIENFFAE